ncbi:wall-associated receptor kinase 2 [Rosa chinensis]|uniref:wall-associated receptor kinase 2 n=1 Tax=Rosa chinensis TaxID=74649 RepID=UPI001AD8DE96|nr:wall-associated receptor kinase 2 [Rosa chinensis]
MLVIQVISLLVGATAVAADQAQPGCLDRCGSVKIPYPFGIGEGCSLREGFNLSCDESAEIPKFAAGVPVTNISLAEGELHLTTLKAYDCYDKNGIMTEHHSPQFAFPPSFTISSTRNNFTAAGCDTLAFLQGNGPDGDTYQTGCTSICNNLKSAVNGSCSSIGCCQTSIPIGLKNRTFTLTSRSNHTKVWGFNRCSYAFVVQVDKFTFNPNTSFLELYNTERLPTILNWEIQDGPCAEAQKRPDYACKENSKCVNRTINDQTEPSGYYCQCLPGFEGNPYLPNGCQDIDECKASQIDPCNNGRCTNSHGNYSCLCNKGFRNQDARTCIKDNIDNQSARKLFFILMGTGSGVGLLLLVIVVWWLRNVIKKRKDRIRKEKFYKQNGGLLLEQQLSSGEVNVEKIKLFSSKELEKATDRFNVDRILGEGGQGTVYKGMLTDGRIVAVKKSKLANGGEVEQFINEIVILSQINHRNVVKLLGCCLETEVPLLIYEFLPNGTISQYIHNHQDEEFPFTWETRLRVSTEVAGALFYLHSAASYPIYHRDIKSTNILLDDKYRAKVADFGTSRSVSVDQTHLTTLVHGTFGYLDPEYFQSSQFTDKSDVYSFGVVLVELLTGQKPVSVTRPQESRSLATYFLISMEQNCLFDIIDAQVMKDGGKEEITKVANIARRCLNLNGKKRPTMKEVAVELEEVRSTIKSSDHVGQIKLAEEGDFRAHEITTKAYWDVVSTSTGPFTDGSTGSSCDVQPLLFSN